jgi:2-dehydropantoate 2-reductase
MDKSDLSILVVGAGAIGGITAALLKKAGYNVEIICKYDDYAKLISESGLHITGACGDFTISMPAMATASEIKDKKDLILLATKATDMIGALRETFHVLKKNGSVISLQNGLCEDELATVAGKERVIGSVVGWGATMEKQGELFMSSSGDFVIGYTYKKQDDYLKSIAAVLASVVPTRVTDNIVGHHYSKLIINSCITSLGVICGLYLGKMLSISRVRSIFIEVIREAIEVAEKMKINVEVFGGKLDFYEFIKNKGKLADLKRHLFIRIIGFKYRKLKSSSLQSVKKGKLTEIDYLNGYIVRNAMELGIEVPVNAVIVDMIHEIEQGRRKVSLENFEDPVFDRFI